jgi:hypothetical protein
MAAQVTVLKPNLLDFQFPKGFIQFVSFSHVMGFELRSASSPVIVAVFFFGRGWGFFFLESELCTRALILLEEEEKEVGNQNLFSYTDAQRDMNVTAVDWRFRV